MSVTDQSDLWIYYQELIKSHGFDGITDLLTEYHNLERVNKEWEALWKPIDELVRPLTPLGESVGDKAVELIRNCLEREPAFWYNPTAKNSVISNASKRTKGTTHLYADWSVPLYD